MKTNLFRKNKFHHKKFVTDVEDGNEGYAYDQGQDEHVIS